MNLYGGSTEKPFRVEYNVGDCQGGWAVLKDGTGQVVGCHKTEEEANKHMEEMTTEPVDILGDEVRTTKSPDEIAEDRVTSAESIWKGFFSPFVKAEESKNVPNDGMVSAAKRALEWKKQGKAGGTSVGFARAHSIVARENLSDSTVKRMYSFFSRHEVDKKATGFNSGEEGYPSPGRVAWDLWGGDAGYSWSRKKAESLSKMEKSMEAKSFWDDVFIPAKNGTMGLAAGSQDQDARFNSTYNTPPQKDGKESTGYGNRSAGTNSN